MDAVVILSTKNEECYSKKKDKLPYYHHSNINWKRKLVYQNTLLTREFFFYLSTYLPNRI